MHVFLQSLVDVTLRYWTNDHDTLVKTPYTTINFRLKCNRYRKRGRCPLETDAPLALSPTLPCSHSPSAFGKRYPERKY